MAVETFHHDDEAYERWLGANPTGFVFNHFGGTNPKDNVLHAASCAYLHRSEDAGGRTTYAKVCGADRRDVEREAGRLREGAGWIACSRCL